MIGSKLINVIKRYPWWIYGYFTSFQNLFYLHGFKACIFIICIIATGFYLIVKCHWQFVNWLNWEGLINCYPKPDHRNLRLTYTYIWNWFLHYIDIIEKWFYVHIILIVPVLWGSRWSLDSWVTACLHWLSILKKKESMWNLDPK